MKKLIFSFILILTINANAFAVWDLIFYSNTYVDIRMEAVSIPFEGLNRADSNTSSNNRINIIQNGNIYRAYSSNTVFIDSQIVLHQIFNTTGNYRLASCFSESVNYDLPRWGFAKYLITIHNRSEPSKSIKFYINTLDSKLGTDTIPGSGYHADWGIYYFGDTIPYVKFCAHCGNSDSLVRYIYQSDIPQEVTMWDLFYNRNTPLEKNFFARSSPFPFSVKTAKEQIRTVVVGTKIVFDTVYENLGASDRYGYNTQNNPYYSNSPQIVPYTLTGHTYITTGVMFDSSGDQITGIKITAESGDSLIFKKSKRLWIYGTGPLVGGDTLLLRSGSYLELDTGAEIFTYNGGVLIDSGSNRKWNNSSCHRAFERTSMNFFGESSKVDNGGFMLIDGDADLKLGDNTTLTFDSPNSFLLLKPNSHVIFGENAKLVFKNGAYIKADGATFNSYNGSSLWDGLVFENSGVDTIINCTFSNAKISVSVINESGYSFTSRVIKNNVFNVPLGGDYKGINGENNFRVTIQNNIFNMPVNPISSKNVFGVYLKNNNAEGVESLPEENEPPTSPYSMYLINNTFNNGTASVVLLNYTSSFLPFYIKGNIFNSAKVTGMLGRSISGTIRDNVTSNNNIPMGIHLITSSPDVFNNAISSKNVSLHTIGSSYPNLAPVVLGNNLSWRGGKNRFSSLESDNIQLVNAGNVYTNLGENRFQIIDTLPDRYHIYGWVDTTVQQYFARNNCWYPGNNPRINLRRIYTSEPIVTETGITTIDCNREIDPNGWIVDYLGNGVYDTIRQSSDTSGSNLTEEELLYNQGQNYIAASMFIEGISALKNLTDTYNYFYDLPASVYDLYSCYEYLDTNSDQDYRNTLYGNLKIYLENKIEYGDYDAEFLSNAYNITLMCEVNMGEYDDAANGYEFISLFHPDPDIRLNASWDYAEVEALIGGGNAGGNKFQVSSYPLREASELRFKQYNEIKEFKEIKELNRINELISNDPVMRKMKESFEKTSKDRKEKQLKDNSSSNENGKEYSNKPESITKENETDKFKSDKAKRNIFELKNLNKQDLEKRRIEDLLLSAKDIRNETDNTQTFSIPLEYKLYQNYPNPFNPVTNLEFGISKFGFVSLKVYDILGKEVAVLVNEKLSPGIYKATFNGSNFASGVYFVRIKSGDFSETKAMMLVK